jgi:hypothetical protein
MSPATSIIDSWIAGHPEYEIDYTITADPAWNRFRNVLGALADA